MVHLADTQAFEAKEDLSSLNYLISLFIFNCSVKCSCTFLCVPFRNKLSLLEISKRLIFTSNILSKGDKCIDFAIKMSSVDLQVPG